MSNITYDVIVLGAGPAGITTALYAKRAGSSVLIIEKDAPGGKIVKTGFVDNFPSYGRISGPDLAMKFNQNLIDSKVVYKYGNIVSVDKHKNIFVIKTETETYYSYAVIVATGKKENLIGIPGEERLYGHGVSYCAVCDGPMTRSEEIAVIGGGNTAVEEAIYLSKFAKTIYFIHRRQGFRAPTTLVKQLKSLPNVKMILDSVLLEINGGSKVEHIKIKNKITNKTFTKKVSFVYPFIGFSPITNFLKNKSILDENNYISVNDKFMTKINGLFAAGDIVFKPLCQITNAISDGSTAGQFANDYVTHLKEKENID